MKKLFILMSVLSISISSFAQTVPNKAFYGGLGVSYNIVSFSNVDANTLGLSDIYINNKLVSTGSADGPFEIPASTENKFGPSVQLGYFQHFNKSQWLWGSKFTYNYVGSTSTSSVLDIPQAGSNAGGTPFTGVAVVQSFQYSLNHQMTLTPYLGHSIKKAFFYLGAGVSLSQTIEDINGVVGYAFINGDTVNISGVPTNFSSTNWVYGFAAVAGGTYFFNPNLFLDFSYTFNPTQNQTNNFISPFSNTKGLISTSGELIGRTSASATTNSFALTINMAF